MISSAGGQCPLLAASGASSAASEFECELAPGSRFVNASLRAMFFCVRRYDDGSAMAIKIGAIKYQECSAKSQVRPCSTPRCACEGCSLANYISGSLVKLRDHVVNGSNSGS